MNHKTQNIGHKTWGMNLGQKTMISITLLVFTFLLFTYTAVSAQSSQYDPLSRDGLSEYAVLKEKFNARTISESENKRLEDITEYIQDKLPQWRFTRFNEDGSVTFEMTDGSKQTYPTNYSSKEEIITASTLPQSGTQNTPTETVSQPKKSVPVNTSSTVTNTTVQNRESTAVTNRGSDGGLGSTDPKNEGFQLIPCDGVDVPCNFKAFVAMFQRILTFLLYLSIPLVVGIILYTGFRYVTAGGDAYKLEEVKKMLIPVAIGIFWVLAAWLVVNTIFKVFLSDETTKALQQNSEFKKLVE